MANKVTIHFRDERAERATYIAQTVGFGEVIRTAEFYNKNGLYQTLQITETGVVIVRGNNGVLITMYIAKAIQIADIYKVNEWGRVPNWLMNKATKNWKKGYIQNQPAYH